MLFGRRLLPGAVFLLVLAVYLSYPTKLYYWDGVAYSLEIESPGKFRPTLTHPNHLVFGPAGYYVHRLLKTVRPEARSIEALQLMSGVAGAGAAAFVCATLLSLGCSAYTALLLSLLMSFAATWWKFSTDAEAYLPSIFFLVLCAWLLLASRRRHPVLLAGAHTAAILFHQLAVLFFPAALAGLVFAGSRAGSAAPVRGASAAGGEIVAAAATQLSADGTRPSLRVAAAQAARAIGTYLGLTFTVTLACYYAGFYLNEHTLDPRRFPAWVTFHTPDSHFTFNPLTNMGRTLLSNVKLFFGGKLTALSAFSWPARIGLVVLLVGFLLALGWKLFRSRSPEEAAQAAAPPGRTSPAAVFLLAWFVCYLAFLFFWLPQNTFYRLFYLPPLILLFGIFIRRRERRSARRYRLALAVAVVALFNFVFFIYPNSRISGNPPLALAQEMKREWAPGTRIYYATLATDDWILMYENPRTAWEPINSPDTVLLEQGIHEAEASGCVAWAETTALDAIAAQPNGAQWLAAHTRPEARRELVNARQRIRLARLFP